MLKYSFDISHCEGKKQIQWVTLEALWKVLISLGLSNCLFRLWRALFDAFIKHHCGLNRRTIWSSITLLRPNCPLRQVPIFFKRQERNEQACWHASNSSPQMDQAVFGAWDEKSPWVCLSHAGLVSSSHLPQHSSRRLERPGSNSTSRSITISVWFWAAGLVTGCSTLHLPFSPPFATLVGWG